MDFLAGKIWMDGHKTNRATKMCKQSPLAVIILMIGHRQITEEGVKNGRESMTGESERNSLMKHKIKNQLI